MKLHDRADARPDAELGAAWRCISYKSDLSVRSGQAAVHGTLLYSSSVTGLSQMVGPFCVGVIAM